MTPNKLRGLYAITPDRADGKLLIAQVEEALSGGCRILQYRDKISDKPEQLARAKALLALVRRFNATLLINDDLVLTSLIGADGVHLGKDDGNLRAARAILGPDKILGASCYCDFPAAEAACAAGVDYVAFGAAYPSPTKPDAPRAAAELFARAAARLPVPSCAIGGITLDNAPPLIAAGVDLLAVITDLFSAPDIGACATQYQQLFERA
jgi:thiamine-phosphate pyrophosphorylase